MPDFTVALIGGGQVPWIDLKSASPEAASRLAPDPDHHPSYRLVVPPAFITPALEIDAVVGGVQAPLDTSLGGRLFSWAWVEWSGSGPPLLQFTAGQSSVGLVYVTSANLGHHILRLRRDGGGAILIPFDVEYP